MFGLASSYPSQSNLQPLVVWKSNYERQMKERRSDCVDKGGCLLEYETYELLRNPPNVNIDNEVEEECTVITLDSANRPGTLVEVVTCLTELGLNIRKARISSDGGWFVDKFHVTDGQRGNKLKDVAKLQSVMQEVLSASMEGKREQNFDEDELDEKRFCSTVFELAGGDRPGLLADITSFLAQNGCDVRSAAVWTHNGRVAFVLSVTQQGQPIKDEPKLKRLQEVLLRKMMQGNRGNASMMCSRVVGLVHHERRLHQLLLQEEKKRWQEMRNVPEASTESEEENTDSHSSDSNLNGLSQSPDDAIAMEDLYRTPKAAKPFVRICKDNQRGYWFVQVTCKDRNKLFFDTVVALSDLNYDIFHASIDEIDGIGYQEYYVRPRWGNGLYKEDKAAKLKWMLEMSIRRRHPKGMKIHVHSTEKFGCLRDLTKVLSDSDLCITRAKAKTMPGKSACDHTLYVMNNSGGPPNKEVVLSACSTIGGKQVSFGKEAQAASSLGNEHKFSFSFQEKWNHELASSLNSFGDSSSDLY